MGMIIFALIIIIIIFGTKNVFLIKDLFNSKEYKKIYEAIINKEPEIDSRINEYLSKETNLYLKSKTNVLLMYYYLQNDINSKDTIEKIDYQKIFLREGKYKKDFAIYNSDMFIWSLCCLPRLKKESNLSVLKNKMDFLQDKLSNHIEYKVFNAAIALLDNNQDDSKFLYDLVNGEYNDLDYDKHLIGVTKRIALAYIASLNKEKNIEYADELKILSGTFLGKNLLTDLEIYEVYK